MITFSPCHKLRTTCPKTPSWAAETPLRVAGNQNRNTNNSFANILTIFFDKTIIIDMKINVNKLFLKTFNKTR